MDNNRQVVTWDEVVKKEARGDNEVDLGEVHEVGSTFVHTVKGITSKTHFYIPKYLIEGFDGRKLWFNIPEGDANKFVRESPLSDDQYRTQYGTSGRYLNVEQSVPMIPDPKRSPDTRRGESGFEQPYRPGRTVTPGVMRRDETRPVGERGPYEEKRPPRSEEDY